MTGTLTKGEIWTHKHIERLSEDLEMTALYTRRERRLEQTMLLSSEKKPVLSAC